MKNRIIQTLVVIAMVAGLILVAVFVPNRRYIIDDDGTALDNGVQKASEIFAMDCDKRVIPDKYNSGVNDEAGLQSVTGACTIDGVNFQVGSDKSRLIVNFYSNRQTGTIHLKNIDFSQYVLSFYNTDIVQEETVFCFENCRFGSVITPNASQSKVSYVFNNCTVQYFGGSNAEFSRCRFGGGCGDALNPRSNVTVKDSYIADISHPSDDPNAVIHADGVQIFGSETETTGNITFENCRFEIPELSCGNDKVYVNACLMVQIEYGNVENISFSNLRINGGGYSVYAWVKSAGLEMRNVSFDNISVGGLRKYGKLYHTVSKGASFQNMTDTDHLYASTVWNTDGMTHVAVTNDTNQERELLICTDKKQYTYRIPACPTDGEIGEEMTFESFPFDVDCTVDRCRWMVCYDVTDGAFTQIRYFNPDDIVLVYDKDGYPEEYDPTALVLSGKAGKDISFVLTRDGRLSFEGTGIMFNYSSGKPAPWNEYRDMIQTVYIGDGITVIGAQAFRGCTGLTSVRIPEGVSSISGNAFNGCKKLTEITIPASLKEFGAYAFVGSGIKNIVFGGTETEWNNISFGAYNNNLLSQNVSRRFLVEEDKDAGVQSGAEGIYADAGADATVTKEIGGQCGENVYWTLSGNTLSLTGTGGTYGYSSGNCAPWYDLRDKITSISIGPGITSLGNQLFRNCSGVSSVSIPDGVSTIGNNAFIGCNGLVSVRIPATVSHIGDYAFHGTSISSVEYTGSRERWDSISIGGNNARLTDTYDAAHPKETEAMEPGNGGQPEEPGDAEGSEGRSEESGNAEGAEGSSEESGNAEGSEGRSEESGNAEEPEGGSEGNPLEQSGQ